VRFFGAVLGKVTVSSGGSGLFPLVIREALNWDTELFGILPDALVEEKSRFFSSLVTPPLDDVAGFAEVAEPFELTFVWVQFALTSELNLGLLTFKPEV
jgi:hypothetical protein